MFTFFETIPFLNKETVKLRKEIKASIFFDSDVIDGLLTKQIAKQIAWIAGFFADLDKETTVDNIMGFISGVLKTLDFNKQLIHIK